ncbi:hypothetical protein IT411_01195 [Candidatus Peregrinibacteria bacterium]|nr:hypothetical protein [Candidatus Peregrinibacteria bacterium]
MTEIKIVKNVLGGGLTRFDLMAKALPEKFLGLAFDLKFKADWSKVAYQKNEFGLLLHDLKAQPLKMVKIEDGVLVVGLTFKAGEQQKLSDGVLMSFYFEGGQVEADGFAKQVLSIFDGQREDVTAEWLMGESQELAKIVQPKSTVQKPLEVEIVDEMQTNLTALPMEWQQILEKPLQAPVEQWADWWIWLVAVLILVVFGLTIGKVRLNSTR